MANALQRIGGDRMQLINAILKRADNAAARVTRGLSLAGIAVLLAACQSGVDGLSEGVSKNDVKAPPSTAIEESFGEKGAEITLLLPKGGQGYYEGEARDVRDGAALGVAELGGDLVRVKVSDISGGSAAATKEIQAAKARGSILLVSYAPQDVTTAMAAIPADQRPVLVNVGRKAPVSGGKAYNFVTEELDSVVEGIKIAAVSGQKKFAVFVQQDYPTSFDTAVSSAVRSVGGTVTGVVRYNGSGSGVSDTVAKAQGLVQSSDTSLILGNTVAVLPLLSAIKASAGGRPMAFVGASGWPEATYTSPAAAGVLIVSVDRENRALIAERYNRRFGRPLSLSAAYGYDIVALAAGIVRSKGATGLTPELLTRKAGFTGVTGLFRLTAVGNVERKLTPYSIGNGKLNPLADAAKAF